MKFVLSILLYVFVNPICYSQEIISATCGNCGKAVSIDSRSGDRCPHCHVRWGWESNENIPVSSTASLRKSSIEEKMSPDRVQPRNPNYLIALRDSVVSYRDRNGVDKLMIVPEGHNYSSDTIDGEFVNLINRTTKQNMGWVQFSKLKIHKKTYTDPDDPSQDKFQLIDSLEIMKLISSADVGSIESRRENSTDNANKVDFSGMTREQARNFIDKKAKAEGAKIYRKSFIRNILIFIGIGLLIFLFREANKSKLS